MTRDELQRYIFDHYSTEPDYPWPGAPNHAVFRHGGNRKWFALVLDVPRNKLGLPGTQMIDVVNLKCDPILIGSLRGEPGIFPAYHMNKDSWLSVALDGSAADDQIRLLLQRIQYLQNVPCNEITVGKPVEGSVLSGRLHGFFYDLHSGHMLRHRRQDLGDGPSAAVKIEHLLPAGIPYVLAHCIVKHLRPQGIGLEEGERGDLEFQSEEFFIEVVLSVEHFCLIALYNIRQGIIYDMEESDNLSFQRPV